jgi:hypothetical protein
MVSDNWTSVMYYALYSERNSNFGYFIAAIFFVASFLLFHSTYKLDYELILKILILLAILLDISVAVILENFELDEDEKEYGQMVALINKVEKTNQQTQSNIFR